MADSTVLVTTAVSESDETTRAQMLAHRYRCDFVDLKNFRIQHELFRSVPVDMMFRYNFVPLEQMEDRLIIAVSDPFMGMPAFAKSSAPTFCSSADMVCRPRASARRRAGSMVRHNTRLPRCAACLAASLRPGRCGQRHNLLLFRAAFLHVRPATIGKLWRVKLQRRSSTS